MTRGLRFGGKKPQTVPEATRFKCLVDSRLLEGERMSGALTIGIQAKQRIGEEYG